METIAKLEDTETGKVLMPTFDAFTPLLEEKRETFFSTNKATLQFGHTPRHSMDVYYPEPALVPSNQSAPVLFFFYGGGFTTGGRSLPKPYDVVYANIGWYFAQHGIATIVSDYRLVPDIQFPAGADDVYQAVLWAIENKDKVVQAGNVPYSLNFDSVFLMGHGSGVVHLATALFMPGLLTGDPETKDKLAGVVFVSGTYNTRALPEDDVVAGILAQYWGTFEATKKNSPQALLESAPDDLITVLPEMLIVDTDKQPHWLEVGSRDFHKALAERTKRGQAMARVEPALSSRDGEMMVVVAGPGRDDVVDVGTVTRLVAVGHNQISVHLSPGSGEGEEWAEAVTKWMRVVLRERVVIV